MWKIIDTIDPRAKILSALILAITTAALHTLPLLGIVLVSAITLLFLTKVSIKNLLVRLIPVLPFLIPIALFLPVLTPGTEIWAIGFLSVTLEGIQKSTLIVLRMLSIIFIFAALIQSTKQQVLFTALTQLGVPKIFIQIAEFTFRYLGVLNNEIKTMLTARLSRGYTKRQIFSFSEVKQLGSLIGMLFLRSFGRAERIYLAMLARGYSSDSLITTKKPFKKYDLAVSLGMLLFSTFLLLMDKGGLQNWL